MSKKSLLFKSIATVVTTVAVTMSVATGTTIGRVMERNDNTSELPADGNKGKEGRGISAVEKTNTYGLIDEYTITYTDDTTSTFIVVNGADGEQGIQGFPGKDGETPTIEIGENGTWVINGTDTGVAVQGAKGDQGEQGEKGEDGRSIESVVKTETNGLVDTYTITYSDGSTSEFLVVNGANGEQGIQGLPGQDGHTPTIEVGANGNWVVDGEDTGVKAQGQQGEAGTSVYTGAGNPNDNNVAGKQGDAYIDSETWDYYVFNGETWEHQGNIQGGQGQQGQTGEQGPQGEQGSSVLIGVDDPSDDPLSPSNAREGDAYINTTTGNIFKLVEGHWEIFGNLQGAQGQAGENGRSVESIEKTETNGLVDTYTITYSEGDPSTFTVTNGADGQNGATLLFGATDPEEEQGVEGDSYVNVSSWEYWVKENGAWVNKGSFRGDDGVSITDITKSGSEGRVDTYTITYSDSTNENPHTTSFTVTNGNTLITGTTNPSNIGNDGDSYLNTQTWEYFVKEDGVWVSQGHISGTSFRTGHGNPNDNSVSGINGDSYLDLDEWKFYSYNANESKWDFDANLFEKYVITFNTNGGSEAPEAQTVREGRKAVKPVVDPTKENYFFQGWYTAEGNKWDFEKDVVSGSLTLYAHWAQFEVTNGVLTGCSATGDVIVPSYFNDQMVTEIGEGLFENNEIVTSVTLPNTVTSIADNAFKGSKVEEVYLPESLLTIGNNAFSGCTKLTSIVIPNSVRSIGANAFDGATALKYVVINDTSLRRLNALNIGNEAFKDCAQLVAVTMPNRVNSIGANAFTGCANLESLTVPFVGGSKEENQTLGYLFDNAVPTSLKTVILTGDTAIGENAFANAASIENLIFEGVPESFAKNALSDLTSLKKLEVPYVVGDYLGYVFGAETYNENNANVPVSLKEVTVTGEEAIVENAFYGLVNLTNIEIENSVSVGDSAFEGCEALENLKLNTTYSANFYKLFGAQDENETETKVPHSLKNVELMNATNVPDAYFHNIRYVENVTLNEGITSIGDNAFALCVNLRNVNLPNTVTSIGENGFSYCAYLKSVVLPDNLTSLGVKAFLGCSSIQTIKLPKGLTSIPTSAFEGCSSLTYLSVPETVTSIADRAFANCQSLASVTFNGDLTTLGSEAFASCYALNNVTVPNVTGTLGTGVFKDCNTLKFAVLPTNMTEIPESMFEGCSSLQNINIDQLTGLTTIGSHAFKNCASIKVIVISNSVQTIGAGVFAGCSSLESLTTPFVGGSRTANKTMYYMFDGATPNAAKLRNKTYTELDTNVPASLKVVRITDSEDIGQFAFAACSSIKYILIDCDIDSISGYAFFGCHSLNSVVLPETLEEIKSYAFAYCTSLIDVEIPDATWMLYSYAFAYCTSLRSIEAWGLFDVGGRCFAGCTSLIDVTLYADTINQYAFEDCTSLDYFGFSSSTTTIGPYLFSGCTNLKRVVISNSVTNIQSNAFYNCTGLTEIVVPNPAASIGYAAFQGCTNLESITIPLKSAFSTLVGIFGGTQGLNACTKLRTINITEGATVLGDSAFSGFNGSNVVINLPSTLKTIGPNALANTTGITSLVIPEGVETIDQFALSNSEYVYIQLPSTLKTLGNNSLSQNLYLKHVVIPSGVTNVGTSVLSGCVNIESLEVPFLGATNAMDDTKQFLGYYWGQPSYTGNENGVPASLKTVVIGGGRETIATNAFYWAKNIETVVFGEGVKVIQTMVFYYSQKLKTIVFPESLQRVESFAFKNAPAVETLVLPEGYVDYEYGAFWSFTNLKNLTVSLYPLIENYTLNVLSSEEDPTDSDGANGDTWANTVSGFYFYKANDAWHRIGNVYKTYGANNYHDYYDWDYYKGVIVSDTPAAFDNDSYRTTWLDPTTGDYYWYDVVNLYTKVWVRQGNIRYNCLTTMLGGAMHATAMLETITIRGADYIPDYLFAGLNVKTVILPEGVEYIGASAFENCHSLETVNIPSSVESIGSRAFYECNSLKNIEIPTSVTRVEDYTFYGCSSLTSLAIHNDVTYIGSHSLASCTSLESISLPFIGKAKDINADYSYFAYIFGGEKYNPLVDAYAPNSYGVPDSLKAVVLTGLNGANGDALPDYAFAGLRHIEYVVLPNNATAIGAYAFRECESLASYVVSNNVTSIGKGAFKDCDGLESITLPFIGSGSNDTDEQYFAWIFDGAKFDSSALGTYNSDDANIPESLQTVVLNNNANYTSVYEGAFAYCSNIKNLVLNNNYTTVQDYAFVGCSSFENFELPNVVSTIGDYAFACSNGWNKVNFYKGEGAPKVNLPADQYTWYIDYNTGIVYTLKDGVWQEGKYYWRTHAYSSDYGVPNNYGEDGDYVYWNGRIYVKYNGSWDDVARIYVKDFHGQAPTDSGFTNYIYVDTEYGTIYIYDSHYEEYTEGGFGHILTGHGKPTDFNNYNDAKDYFGKYYLDLDGAELTASGHIAYLYYLENYDWKKLDLPIRIGDGPNPNTDMRVDREGDLYLDTLTNKLYVFNNGAWVENSTPLTTGSESPISGAASGELGHYYLQNGTDLYLKASNGLETVTIPYGVTKVSDNAFSGCTGLKTVILPATVTEIGSNAFANCTSLENLVVKGHITKVNDGAFNNVTKLKDFDFSYITYVGAGAFANTNISHAYFTLGTVTKIGDNAFEGCNNLTNVVINNASGLALGDNSFKNCYSLNSVVLPNSGVVSIGDSAFENCYSLTSFMVPSSVTSIGQAAFKNCRNLTTLALHNALENIGENAFQNCYSLTRVIAYDFADAAAYETFVNDTDKVATGNDALKPGGVLTVTVASFQA